MNALSPIAVLVAGAVGIITGIVGWRVLRSALNIDSPLLGMCIGALSGIGLATQMEGVMSTLLISYESLAIAVVLMFLMAPFFKDKKDKDVKPLPPETQPHKRIHQKDPWEDEIRGGGPLAKRFRSRPLVNDEDRL